MILTSATFDFKATMLLSPVEAAILKKHHPTRVRIEGPQVDDLLVTVSMKGAPTDLVALAKTMENLAEFLGNLESRAAEIEATI